MYASIKSTAAMAKGVWAFSRVVRDLKRTDEIFDVVAELRTPELIRPLVEHFAKDPVGAEALQSWPRVGRLDIAALRTLPPGTLGREYADHMTRNGLSPDFHPDLKIGSAMDYVSMHLYETHDIWHAVTGFDTSEAGELGLQAFYLAQFPAGPVPPVLLAAGLLNGMFFARSDLPPRMDAIVEGWHMGKKSRALFGMRWADMWERPLTELRRELAIA